MENKIKILLNDTRSHQLLSAPEKGMGYHIVDVVLKDGKVLKDKVVLNSSILQLNANEVIEEEEISAIEIH